MTITAPVTQIAASSIVPAFSDHDDLDFFERAPAAVDDFFDDAVAFERVDFFNGIDGPPSTCDASPFSKGGARYVQNGRRL